MTEPNQKDASDNPQDANSASLNLDGNAQLNAGRDVIVAQQINQYITAAQSIPPGEKLFNHHIEPLYIQAMKVAADYRLVLTEIRQKLNADESYAAIIQGLTTRRLLLAPNRDELYQYANLLQQEQFKSDTIPTKEFTVAAVNLLASEPAFPKPLGFTTAMSSILEDFEELVRRGAPRQQFVERVDSLLAEITLEQQTLTAAYLKLRILCLQ